MQLTFLEISHEDAGLHHGLVEDLGAKVGGIVAHLLLEMAIEKEAGEIDELETDFLELGLEGFVVGGEEFVAHEVVFRLKIDDLTGSGRKGEMMEDEFLKHSTEFFSDAKISKKNEKRGAGGEVSGFMGGKSKKQK